MKMLDFCLEIDKLSKETGYSIPNIIERIKKCENQLAEITMVTSIPFEYVCGKFVLSDFDITAVQPAIIKSEYEPKRCLAQMHELANQFIDGKISRDKYFKELGELKKDRGA